MAPTPSSAKDPVIVLRPQRLWQWNYPSPVAVEWDKPFSKIAQAHIPRSLEKAVFWESNGKGQLWYRNGKDLDGKPDLIPMNPGDWLVAEIDDPEFLKANVVRNSDMKV